MSLKMHKFFRQTHLQSTFAIKQKVIYISNENRRKNEKLLHKYTLKNETKN